MRNFVWSVLCFGLLFCLAACTETKQNFTQSDTGSTISLAQNEPFTVTLEGNPATGYEWALDADISSGVELVGEPEYSSSSKAIGSGGTYVFTFKAIEAGEHTLQLKYWRSFEPNTPPTETFVLKMQVE
jgi:inhibitor of cysteine peptidase